LRGHGSLIIGILIASAIALAACGNAHAALPRTEQVSVTGSPVPRGCGIAAPPGSSTLTMHVGGRDRLVRLHIPKGYRPDEPIPLVLSLHGSGSTAARHAAGTGMDATSDQHAFLLAYPEAQRRFGSGFAWNVPGTPTWQARGPDEDAFLGQLISLLHNRYCVDLNRVYAVGFSGGGRLLSQFACTSQGVLVAVAVIGGLRAPVPCPSGPVPVLAVHGTADPQNPYDGHGQPYWTYGVPEAVHRWAAHDGCVGVPAVTRTAPGVTLTAYHSCRADSVVLLYTLGGKGHVWPVARSTGLDGNETVWQFFAEYPHQGANRPLDHAESP
jgi:polyhydroxybutyrate depolymerase